MTWSAPAPRSGPSSARTPGASVRAQLEHDVRVPVVALAGVDQADDVRMGQRRAEHHLAAEPFRLYLEIRQALGVPQPQDLDGDVLAGRPLAPLVDASETARADLRQHLVTTLEPRASRKKVVDCHTVGRAFGAASGTAYEAPIPYTTRCRPFSASDPASRRRTRALVALNAARSAKSGWSCTKAACLVRSLPWHLASRTGRARQRRFS